MGLAWFVLRLVVKLSFFLLRSFFRISFFLARRLLALQRTSHGSARWAGWFDLIRGGAWGRRDGLIVAKAYGRFVRHRSDGAALVYAPMGSGKGVGLVIPNLIDHPGALICTDPKGENLAVTGRWRQTLGPVYRLDALHPETAHRFNPFDMIRAGTHHEADDIAALADLLITPESSEAHWDTSARQLTAMLIGHVLHAYPPPLRTLSAVRELIALGGDSFRAELERMARCPVPSIAEQARIVLGGFDTDEMASVISNAAKALQFWSRDRIGGLLTSASDFDFLNMHIRTKTIYVVVPEDKLRVYQPFLRLMMGCALAAAVRGKELPPPKHKPLLLIDEAAALGRLEALENGLGYLRAYARILLVFQDIGQITRLYGEYGARTFLAASSCQVAFNVHDNMTARELAEAIGMTTTLSHSHGSSQPSTAFLHHQLQAGHAESGRYLLDPAEIRRQPAHRCLVFLPDRVPMPIRGRKVRYYTIRRWQGRWDRWRPA